MRTESRGKKRLRCVKGLEGRIFCFGARVRQTGAWVMMARASGARDKWSIWRTGQSKEYRGIQATQ